MPQGVGERWRRGGCHCLEADSGRKRRDQFPGTRSHPTDHVYFLSFLLIGTFLWRAFTAAHEFDSREFVYFSIGLDILCIIGLLASKRQISMATPPDQEFWAGGTLLCFVALMAGLGLLAIRLHSDPSWWTGHIRYELLPR